MNYVTVNLENATDAELAIAAKGQGFDELGLIAFDCLENEHWYKAERQMLINAIKKIGYLGIIIDWDNRVLVKGLRTEFASCVLVSKKDMPGNETKLVQAPVAFTPYDVMWVESVSRKGDKFEVVMKNYYESLDGACKQGLIEHKVTVDSAEDFKNAHIKFYDLSSANRQRREKRACEFGRAVLGAYL